MRSGTDPNEGMVPVGIANGDQTLLDLLECLQFSECLQKLTLSLKEFTGFSPRLGDWLSDKKNSYGMI